jgi:hypothetical protein
VERPRPATVKQIAAAGTKPAPPRPPRPRLRPVRQDVPPAPASPDEIEEARALLAAVNDALAALAGMRNPDALAHIADEAETTVKNITATADSIRDRLYGREIENAFEVVWAVRPRRQGEDPKQPALKAYRRAVIKGEGTIEEIQAGIERSFEHYRDRDPKYTPMLSTWLNQHRWRDELWQTVESPSIFTMVPT